MVQITPFTTAHNTIYPSQESYRTRAGVPARDDGGRFEFLMINVSRKYERDLARSREYILGTTGEKNISLLHRISHPLQYFN